MTSLEDTLGIKFNNPALLTEALTHRSYLNENRGARSSNERLEFLGDSVLSLLTSTELYHRFPNSPEGQLTSLRSALVRAKTLAKLAKKLHLGDALLMSRGEEKSGGRENETLLANSFEAILGAVYLDSGLEAAQKILELHLFPLVDSVQEEQSVYDYKSRLQELTQQETRVSPTYKVLGEEGPDHQKTFSVGVYLQKKLLAKGLGKSKQEAEQEAAKNAIENFKLKI